MFLTLLYIVDLESHLLTETSLGLLIRRLIRPGWFLQAENGVESSEEVGELVIVWG